MEHPDVFFNKALDVYVINLDFDEKFMRVSINEKKQKFTILRYGDDVKTPMQTNKLVKGGSDKYNKIIGKLYSVSKIGSFFVTTNKTYILFGSPKDGILINKATKKTGFINMTNYFDGVHETPQPITILY